MIEESFRSGKYPLTQETEKRMSKLVKVINRSSSEDMKGDNIIIETRISDFFVMSHDRNLGFGAENRKWKIEELRPLTRACLVPRARLELARQYDPSQDFKSCASTSFATGAKLLASWRKK